MSNEEFRPNWASAPGDTILDILRERNLSENEFAHQINYELADTRDLLQGRIVITLALARQLSQVLGASIEFWMARDFQYRQDIARFNITERQWINDLPIADMIGFKWIPPVSSIGEKITACL